MVDSLSPNAVYQRCLALLSRREYSQGELRQKMIRQGVDENTIKATLSRLQADGYQSDARFIESFVRSRLNKRHGGKKIAYELQQRGISSALAKAEIAKHDEEQLANAQTLIVRKAPRGDINTLFTDFKLKEKVTRSLVNKGYDFDTIRSAFARLREGM